MKIENINWKNLKEKWPIQTKTIQQIIIRQKLTDQYFNYTLATLIPVNGGCDIITPGERFSKSDQIGELSDILEYYYWDYFEVN